MPNRLYLPALLFSALRALTGEFAQRFQMPSWAAVLQQPVAEVAPPTAALEAEKDAGTTAVVDANAVIGGTDLRALAENLITVPEVLEECRDLQAQQRLQSLPESIKTARPSEDAFKAGARCAQILLHYAVS